MCRYAIQEAKKETAHKFVGDRLVGCSILTHDGQVFLGFMMMGLPGSITAEDFTIHKALTEGESKIKLLCVHYIHANGEPFYEWPNG